jgi:hypothetical protein
VQRNGDSIEAVTIDGATPGLGFPGTQASFAGSTELVEPATFLFVYDTDDDLTTHEAFPAGAQIQMRIGSLVRSSNNRSLPQPGVAFATVGPDTIQPEVRVIEGSQAPMIEPGNDAQNVDPETDIIVQFTEPVQLLTIGDVDDGTTPTLSASVQVTFGPSSNKVEVPFTVENRPPAARAPRAALRCRRCAGLRRQPPRRRRGE